LPLQTSLKNDLIAFGDLKVWSVLVTIFGDLAPSDVDFIPGPVLSALTGQMGIRPEALRVALHRLRKDGWIEASKAGRVSHYRLSAHGRAETEAARHRIYGPFAPHDTGWFLRIWQDAPAARIPQGWLDLGRGMYLTPDNPQPSTGWIVARLLPGALPDWAADRLIPQDVCAGYTRLAGILEAHSPLAPDNLLDALTQRILILHAWRRLILRHPGACLDLLGPDWPGARSRILVLRCLKLLPRPDLSQLTL